MIESPRGASNAGNSGVKTVGYIWSGAKDKVFGLILSFSSLQSISGQDWLAEIFSGSSQTGEVGQTKMKEMSGVTRLGIFHL